MSDPHVNLLLDAIEQGHASEAESAQEPATLRRFLGVRIAGDLYAIDIENISEIIKLPAITFVPGAPPAILGVTSLRGQIVPVVNMRRVLGIEAPASELPAPPGPGLAARPRIVVVHSNEVVAGLLVDSVTEVFDLRGPIQAAPAGPLRGRQIKEGLVPLDDQLAILLHVPALFSQLTEVAP